MSLLAVTRSLKCVRQKLLVQDAGSHCRRGVKMMAARNINPAEPRECERPRQVQILVNAAVNRSCPHDEIITPMSARVTRVVPIRVCTRRDLERMCRPKLCSCPQKKLPRTSKEMFRCFLLYGFKAIVAGGLIYWTRAEGIWGDPEDTQDFYFRIRETFITCPDDEPKMPHLELYKYKIVDSYNRAIFAIMGLLVDIPVKIHRAIRDALYPCEKREPKKTYVWPPECSK